MISVRTDPKTDAYGGGSSGVVTSSEFSSSEFSSEVDTSTGGAVGGIGWRSGGGRRLPRGEMNLFTPGPEIMKKGF